MGPMYRNATDSQVRASYAGLSLVLAAVVAWILLSVKMGG